MSPPTICHSASGRHGFATKLSHPARSAAVRSCVNTYPVSTTTGTCCVCTSCLRRRVRPRPSSGPARRTSVTTASGARSDARRNASAALLACSVQKPLRRNSSAYISRSSAESPTNRTRFVAGMGSRCHARPAIAIRECPYDNRAIGAGRGQPFMIERRSAAAWPRPSSGSPHRDRAPPWPDGKAGPRRRRRAPGRHGRPSGP